MERQEITAGLKNALERGYSLELAVQSFINAGYNRQDAEDSAKSLSREGIIHNIPDSSALYEVKEDLERAKPKGNWKIFILMAILLILLALISWTIFDRESAASFLKIFGLVIRQ